MKRISNCKSTGMIVPFNTSLPVGQAMYNAFERYVTTITEVRGGRDHCPALSISDDMPEAGGGGESSAAPEVASDDDDGGDDDGEPARSRPHSKTSPKPGTASASKRHSAQSRIRHTAEKNPEVQIAVGEFDLAAAIGMSVDFLRKDRSGKRIIPFFRIGKAIRYNLQRVNAALASLEEGGHKPPRPKAKQPLNTLAAG